MSAKHTYAQIAADFRLWAEYADPHATMSQEEFDALSCEEKVALQVEAFGPEPVRAPGRPSEMNEGKRVNVYLDAASLAAAAKLGNGNVSEGIRLALKR